MSAIQYVHARQILDSRGNPTIEVDIKTEDGALDVQQFLLELLQVSTKQLNFVTKTNQFMLEKVF